MLYPHLEKRLQASKQAVNNATSESIVKQCKEYLALLAEYRSQLYELQGTPGLNQQSASPSLSEEVPDRKTIREAIERTTRERNRTQLLLLSFTTVSAYEAVEYLTGGTTEDMTIGNCARAELSFVAETIAT